jgi:hypothetical protein
VCSVPFVVVAVVMCIYSSQYEYTSYTLAIIFVTSHWCDNDNHDKPQHVIGTVKWRDDFDGYKCRSIFIRSAPVTNTVSICASHYMFFPFLLLRAKTF